MSAFCRKTMRHLLLVHDLVILKSFSVKRNFLTAEVGPIRNLRRRLHKDMKYRSRAQVKTVTLFSWTL